MERGKPQAAWSSLDTLLTAGTLGNLADGELLDCFRSQSNAAGHEAFRILVERHGAMVLGLCRSLVRDPHEAEDAFQATFLVLVRRAGSIRQRETIGPWLYGVACRVARRAQIRSARRRKREVAADVDLPARDGPNVEASGTDQAVHEEIRRLPEALRGPLILCCLEGQSYDLAARRLGVREPTLRGRLHRARKTLESRLRRRGILTPTVAGLLDPGSLSLGPLPSSLIESTTQLAVRWSTLRGLLVGAGAVPETIAALAQGVIQAMLFQTVKVCGIAAVLTIGVVGTLVVAKQEKNGGANVLSNREANVASPPEQKAASKTGPAQEDARRLEIEGKKRQILQMLDADVTLDLPEKPTLSLFLKAIKKATSDAHPPGLPIYVDADALLDKAAYFDLPIEGSFIRSAPVRSVLRRALGQLRLSFFVKDDFLMISTQADIAEQRRLDELEQEGRPAPEGDGTDGTGERARGIEWTKTLIPVTIRRWAP